MHVIFLWFNLCGYAITYLWVQMSYLYLYHFKLTSLTWGNPGARLTKT